MKTIKTITQGLRTMLLASGAALLLHTSASAAALVTWQTATNVADSGEVVTNGVAVLATTFNYTVSTNAVNGVNFMNNGTDSQLQNGVGLSLAGSAWWAKHTTPTFFTWGSRITLTGADRTNYGNIFKCAAWGGSAYSAGTMTVSGLNIGDQYLVQFWAYDDRYTAARTETLQSDGGESVFPTLIRSSTGPIPGQFVTGTFTADATSKVFTLTDTSGTTGPQLNAFQIRDLTAAVLPATLQINSQPANQYAYTNYPATFAINASVNNGNQTNVTYQWLTNTIAIPGATNTSYTTWPINAGDNAINFQCVVSYPSLASQTSSVANVVIMQNSAPITWKNANAVTSSTNVDTTGNSVLATFWSGNIASYLINGVTFTDSGYLSQGQNGITATVAGNYAIAHFGLGTFTGPDAANYSAMLNNTPWGGDMTVTLTGLTPGQQYEAQLWVWDPGAGQEAITCSGTDTNVPSLQFTNNVIGTFTANNDGTQIFTIHNGGHTYISAVQLRQLAAPNVPSVTANSGNSNVGLEWNFQSGVTGYYIGRSTTSGSGYTTIAANVSGISTNYVDTNVTVGATYYYIISATNAFGLSANSTEVSALVLQVGQAQVPINLSAMVGPGFAQVTLKWDDASYADTGYNVYRSTTSGGPYTTPLARVSSNNYVDTGATNGVPYYYVVSGTNANGESAPSAEVTIGTLYLWQAPAAITTADATLSQPGTVAGAASFGATEVIVTLSNGTNIDFTTDGSVATCVGGWATGTYGFTGSTANTNFDAVLGEYFWDNGPKTITLNNLVVGQPYAVQLFALDDRNGKGDNTATFQDPNDATDISASFYMSNNVYVVATFTATSSTMNIKENLPVSNDGNINALVIWNLGSPQPPVLSGISTNATVAINWSYQSSVTGYTLKRSTTSGSGYATIAGNLSGVSTSYVDTNVTIGVTYYYVASATNSFGVSANSAEVAVLVPLPVNLPTVAFSGTPTTGAAPLSVVFTNTTIGSVTNSAWNFGDGNTVAVPSAANVTNTYATAGTYTVSLVVAGLGGVGTLTNTAYIVVTNAVVISSDASLSYLALSPLGALTPNFNTTLTNYTATNAIGTTSVTVTVTNTSALATNALFLNGVLQGSPAAGSLAGTVAVAVGSGNVIQVVVTAQDGVTTSTNTVTVTVLPSTNAYLTSLVLNPTGQAGLTTSFVSTTLSYLATNAYGYTPTFTVVNADLTATNSLIYNNITNGLASGVESTTPTLNLTLGVTNVAQVQVTAQDGVTVQTYQVNIVEQPSQTVPHLTNSVSGNNLVLSWPADHLGYRLLVQTNNLNKGVSGNIGDWGTVPGSTNLTGTSITILKTGVTNMYYKLVYP